MFASVLESWFGYLSHFSWACFFGATSCRLNFRAFEAHHRDVRGLFSQAYVQAIAACAGFAWSKPSVDEDSVDLMLSQRGGRGTIRSPRLEIQLKCTEKEAILGEDGTFPFSIPRKNYDDLRDITLHVPRISLLCLSLRM